MDQAFQHHQDAVLRLQQQHQDAFQHHLDAVHRLHQQDAVLQQHHQDAVQQALASAAWLQVQQLEGQRRSREMNDLERVRLRRGLSVPMHTSNRGVLLTLLLVLVWLMTISIVVLGVANILKGDLTP